MSEALSLFLDDVTLPVYLLGSALVLIAFWIIRTEMRLRRLLRGKNGSNLEDTILLLQRKQEGFEVFQKELEQYLVLVEERLRRSVQGVETLRFNPFGGGNSGQSFATAFLNEKGDGVVLSSLYARDRMSVFAKPVRG